MTTVPAKHLNAVPVPGNWDEVDRQVERLGEIEVSLSMIEDDITMRVNAVRSRYAPRIDDLNAEAAAIRAQIEAFAAERKEEFGKTRSRKLRWGRLAYRTIRSVLIRNPKTCLKGLRELGLSSCIRVTEEPDKKALGKLGEQYLRSVWRKIGVRVLSEDRLRIEPDLETIRRKRSE